MEFDEIIERLDKVIKELEESEVDFLLETNNKEDNNSNNEELINRIDFKTDDLHNSLNKIYSECLLELNGLIGLQEVKDEIKKLINYLIYIKKVGNKLNVGNINLNMIFRGNSGTGKTTVAKIVAKILCELGFIKNNKVLETTPKDFIAGYTGQTALKTHKIIATAEGGVILIDEAYTFAKSMSGDSSSFVPEAITEIIKEMETKNTIFIFCGYSKDMDDFIKLNSGIKSRIGYDIEFQNYTKNELYLIFCKKLHKAGLRLNENARNILLKKIEERMCVKDFGNGRMIDNLFEQILREHATITINEENDDKLLEITEESIYNIKTKNEGGICFG